MVKVGTGIANANQLDTGLLGQPAHSAVDLACCLGLLLPRRIGGRRSRLRIGGRGRSEDQVGAAIDENADAPIRRCRRGQTLSDAAADGVIFPDVHNHVDAALGRVDQVFQRGQRRSAIAVQLHRRGLQTCLDQGRIESIRTRTQRRRLAMQAHADTFTEDAPSRRAEPCRLTGEHSASRMQRMMDNLRSGIA
jgi:hypothetical protein